MDNFHQGGKYSAQIDSHQAELRREEKITDKKSLSNLVQKKCTFCGGANHSKEFVFKRLRNKK